MKLLLSDEMYVRFRELLQSRAGLFYSEHRRDDLAHGLGQVLAGSAYPTLDALYAEALKGGAAWEAMLAKLTVGETRFFRNHAHFDALRQHIISDILNRRASLRGLRLWSAGCASGEEPYSLAMLITDLLPDWTGWSISILGTDINQQFLQKAREGLYSAWSFRETSEEMRQRFFTEEDGRWRLIPSIRRAVTFAWLNLAESSYPSIANGTSALDMIICRNVSIYFDRETTRKMAARFYSALTPGGWLLVGHSEPQAEIYEQFETHNFPNAIVYRKSLDAPLFLVEGSAISSKPHSAAASARVTVKDGRFRQGAKLLSPQKHEPPTNDTGCGNAAAARRHITTPLERKRSSSTERRVTTPLERMRQEAEWSAEAAWKVIQAYLAQGEKTQAEEALRTFLQHEPRDTAAMVALGRLCADRADWACAQEWCERALALNTLSVDAAYLLGQVYEHKGRLDDALAAYRRTIYANHSFVPGLLGMANVWRQMGLREEARRSYRNLLRLLELQTATEEVAGMDGVTVCELVQFVRQQLERLA